MNSRRPHHKTRRFIDHAGHIHEYTFSCFRRLKLLNRDRTRAWFIDAMALIRQRYDILIIAYVVMPEHAHVLLMPGPDVDMKDVAKTLKQSVARKALGWLRKARPDFLYQLQGENAGNRARHHFWQPGGGFDRNMVSPQVIMAAIDYLHQNPIRRGLVKIAEDWHWSSARHYAGLDEVKIPMDPIQL